jgi:anti-anti-sigma factor
MNYESSGRLDEKARTYYLEITGRFHGVSDPHPRPDYAALAAQGARRVAVDLSRARMVTSGGVRSLLTMKEEAEQRGLSFVIVCDQETVQDLFRDLHLDRLLRIVRTRGEIGD